MMQPTDVERELERRLVVLETVEQADPAHARLSGATLITFLAVVAAVAGLGGLLVQL